MLSKRTLYKALKNQDSKYLGFYYAAVKTTGIYCKITCGCKKPLYRNVEFYDSIEKCISKGFRECRICNPLSSELKNSNVFVYSYIRWIESIPFPDKSYRLHKVKDLQTLTKSKKLFESTFGISLGKYIRIKRVNYIMKNNDIIDDIKQTNVVMLNYISTPLGEMVSCHTDNGLHLLEFIDRKSLETELDYIKKKFNGEYIFRQDSFSKELTAQINQYFQGKRKEFDIKLSFIGTDYQIDVWEYLLSIKYGTKISYKEMAEFMKKPNHVRSIASANGKNMISIIVPCHRVISSDGSIGGYGGGIIRKEKLLKHESQ